MFKVNNKDTRTWNQNLNPQEAADLVTFTEEILNGKLYFFVQCYFLVRIFIDKYGSSIEAFMVVLNSHYIYYTLLIGDNVVFTCFYLALFPTFELFTLYLRIGFICLILFDLRPMWLLKICVVDFSKIFSHKPEQSRCL